MRVAVEGASVNTVQRITERVRDPIEAHLWAVLDAIPFAVILVCRDQSVRGMNAHGRALLCEADAVRFDGLQLHATASDMLQELFTMKSK